MAIFIHGKKVGGLFYKGKKIQSLYYKGKKIYSSFLPVGTVASSVSGKAYVSGSMAPGAVNSAVVLKDSTISLGIQLKNVKTGLVFVPPASNKSVTFIQPSNSYTIANNFDSKIPAQLTVSKTDLLTGAYVTLWNPNLGSNGDGILKVKYDSTNDSLSFMCDRSTVGRANWNNSTSFATNFEPGAWALLIIQSIETY